MRILAGPGAQVYFTHLSQTSSDSLTKIFEEAPNSDVLAQTLCHKIGVLDLMKQSSMPLEKVCLLDPKAEEELSPRDGDGRFSWFLFGVCLSYSVKLL
jgi:ribosome biogenesis SPOUT family RNA methylase Rps3